MFVYRPAVSQSQFSVCRLCPMMMTWDGPIPGPPLPGIASWKVKTCSQKKLGNKVRAEVMMAVLFINEFNKCGEQHLLLLQMQSSRSKSGKQACLWVTGGPMSPQHTHVCFLHNCTEVSFEQKCLGLTFLSLDIWRSLFKHFFLQEHVFASTKVWMWSGRMLRTWWSRMKIQKTREEHSPTQWR